MQELADRIAEGIPAPTQAKAGVAVRSQAVAVDQKEARQALEITAGQLVYQIPRKMWRDVPETIEVRLGTLEAQGIMQGFLGRGEVDTERLPIVETMTVSLVSPPGVFDIIECAQQSQLVKPDLVKGTPLQQDDFGRWNWVVTPRKRGRHALYVKISAALKDSRGVPTTSSLPDRTIRVVVRVRFSLTAARLFKWAGGTVGSALLAAVTRDYWWPWLRSQWENWWHWLSSILGH
jgi:hypothetical protein